MQCFRFSNIETQKTHNNSEIRSRNFQSEEGLEPVTASPQPNKYHMYTLIQKGDSPLEEQATRHCSVLTMALRETLVPVANLKQDTLAGLTHDYKSRIQFLGWDLPWKLLPQSSLIPLVTVEQEIQCKGNPTAATSLLTWLATPYNSQGSPFSGT